MLVTIVQRQYRLNYQFATLHHTIWYGMVPYHHHGRIDMGPVNTHSQSKHRYISFPQPHGKRRPIRNHSNKDQCHKRALDKPSRNTQHPFESRRRYHNFDTIHLRREVADQSLRTSNFASPLRRKCCPTVYHSKKGPRRKSIVGKTGRSNQDRFARHCKSHNLHTGRLELPLDSLLGSLWAWDLANEWEYWSDQ